MAIIFELVVNFGLHDDAVAHATEELDRKPAIEVRDVQLPVTPPFVTTLETSGYLEFSVHPRGIGAEGQGPYPPFNPRDLGDDEIGAVGDQLYDCLRRFHGYEAAVVGWDPESLVDPAELEVEVPDAHFQAQWLGAWGQADPVLASIRLRAVRAGLLVGSLSGDSEHLERPEANDTALSDTRLVGDGVRTRSLVGRSRGVGSA